MFHSADTLHFHNDRLLAVPCLSKFIEWVDDI